MPDYYAPQTWFNGPTGGTPVSAARLNHMEAGIDAVDSAVQAVEIAVAAIDASDLEANGSYAAPSTVVMRTRVTADPQPRWVLHAGGLQEWGDGTSAPDVNLYRPSASTLKTDGQVLVGLNIYAQHNVGTQVCVGDAGPSGQSGISFQAGESGSALFRSAAGTLSIGGGVFQAGYGRFGSDVSFVDYNALRATSIAAGSVASVVKGFAAQTADLTQWQNGVSSTMLAVISDGRLVWPGGGTLGNATGSTNYIDMTVGTFRVLDPSYTRAVVVFSTGVGGTPIAINAPRTDGANQVALDLADGLTGVVTPGFGSVIRWTSNSGSAQADIQMGAGGTGTNNESEIRFRTQNASGDLNDRVVIASTGLTSFFDGTLTSPKTTTDYGQIVRGRTSQSAHLQQWQNSTGAALVSVTAAGAVIVSTPDVGVTFSGVASGGPSSLGLVSTPASTLDLRLPVGGMRFINNAYTNVEGQVSNSGEWSFPSNSAPVVPVTVVGAASQSGALTQWLDSTATALTYVGADGAIVAPALFTSGGVGISNAVYASAYLSPLFTGPTMHMDGSTTSVVQSAGKAAFTVFAVQGAASQTGDLQHWRDSSGAMIAHVRNDGLIAAPYFTNAADSGPYLQMTPNIIAVADRNTDTGVMFQVASGTQARLTVERILSGNAGTIGLLVDAAASQTADLQQWRNSVGGVLAKVDASGTLVSAVNLYASSGAASQTIVGGVGPSGQSGVLLGLAGDTNLYRSGAGQLATSGEFFATNGLHTSSNVYVVNGPVLESDGVNGIIRPYGVGTTIIKSTATTVASLVVQSVISQTASLQEWVDSTAATLAKIAADGTMTLSGGAAFINLNNASSASNTILAANVASDTVARLLVSADGKHQWGPGNAAIDTTLYRQGVATLRTDGALQTGDYLAVGVNVGGWALNSGLAAGASATGAVLSYGTGAPVNASGANGDIYLRVDGGALTTIYQRRAGAWVGIV